MNNSNNNTIDNYNNFHKINGGYEIGNDLVKNKKIKINIIKLYHFAIRNLLYYIIKNMLKVILIYNITALIIKHQNLVGYSKKKNFIM